MAMTIFMVLCSTGVIFLVGVFVSLCRAGDGKSVREVMTLERRRLIVELPDTRFAGARRRADSGASSSATLTLRAS